MKKLLNWIKSPKSDFVLFIFLLILLNIASEKAFVRFDLTAPKSYSLSQASKTVVKNLQEPLSIRVFFDENLPNQYNSVAQYVKDILTEYKGVSNKNFTVSYMKMKDEKNIALANNLGVQKIQIQELKNNEVGFKQVYMGMVISYGDSIEVINPVTSADGFEYTLTTTMSKMISKADSLNGLKSGDKITLTLYLSDVLNTLGINGANQTEQIVREAYNKVNIQAQNRIEFVVQSPDSAASQILSEKYGIQTINYRENNGSMSKAALGLVLSHGEKFYALPIEVAQSFFGYAVAGLDDVETSINEGLQSLLSNVKAIGYITGHDELTHDANGDASSLSSLIAGLYELVDIDLNTADIPSGMNSVIINSPKFDYTEEELYKLDQFVMRGGNILFFVEGVEDDGTAMQYGLANYVPKEVNVTRLIENYGVKIMNNMVMDKNSYEAVSSQYGKVNLYWAPVMHKANFPKKNIITNNLGYVIGLENSSIDVSAARENKDLKVTVLTKSSPESWLLEDGFTLHPLYINPPSDSSTYKSYDLTALIEGKFKSIFDEPPVVEEKAEGEIETSNHISSSLLPGKIFVAGSSAITTNQVIADDGSAPAGMFLLNVIDYLNGHEDLCSMRTKSLAVNTLTIKHNAAANFWRYFEQYGLVVIVALIGFIVLRVRSKRRKAINKKYNPNDTRVIK